MKSIFVSSTFGDMQMERDLLQQKILPEVRDYLKQYGENVNFVDLRWGVDTTDLESDEGMRKILSVCIDQIDNCKPYMIVFLGDRYGSIPSKESVLQSGTQDLIQHTDVLDKSVTAIEIEYGAMMTNGTLDKDHIFFYFRNPLDYSEIPKDLRGIYHIESEESQKKLDELKTRITEKFPNSVQSYSVSWDTETDQLTNYDELQELILSDLKQSIDKEFANFKPKNMAGKGLS